MADEPHFSDPRTALFVQGTKLDGDASVHESTDVADSPEPASKKLERSEHDSISGNNNDGDDDVARRKRFCHEDEAKWSADSPSCFHELFEFFYTADYSRGDNPENAFLAQALPYTISVYDEHYRSAIFFYYINKANVVKQFKLPRRTFLPAGLDGEYKVLNGQYMDADNQARLLKAEKIAVNDMKKFVDDFAWTNEAVQVWDNSVLRILYLGNFYKFTRHPNLRRKLLETENKYLIKACPNTCNCTCGIRCRYNIAMQHRDKWSPNLLGKTLIRVRDDIRKLSGRIEEQHPTEEQLAAVWTIRSIDDGRNHECEKCWDFR